MTDYVPRRPETRLLTSRFFVLLAATASFGLAFSAYFLLPKYLAVVLGADPATIGGLNAISMFASVVAMPFVGIQVDRLGRKGFGIAGALVFALASGTFYFIDEIGIVLWIVRILQGFAFTMFYVAMSTLATDLAPEEKLGQAIGLFGGVMIATNALGPALAEWGATAYGWPFVFAMTSVMSIGAIILTFGIIEKNERTRDAIESSITELLASPSLIRVLIAAILVGVTMGTTFTFYQPWALSLGYTEISGYLVGFAICAMFVRIVLGSVADKFGRLNVAIGSLFLYIFAPLCLIYVDSIGLFYTGAILGIAHGLFFPALNAVALEQVSGAGRGKGMAVYHGAFNIGFASGSYLLGYVAMNEGYPTIFSIASFTCILGLIILINISLTQEDAKV